MPTVLVTGGCGFIGSNFIRHLLATDPDVARRQLRLPDLRRQPRQPRRPRRAPALPLRQGRHHRPRRRSAPRCSAASRTSSTSRPRATSTAASRTRGPFVRTNVLGTQVLLDAAREFKRAEVRPGLDRRGVRQPRRRPGCSPKRRRCTRTARTPRARPRPTCSCRRTTTPSACPPSSPAARTTTGPYQFPEKLIPLFITQPAATTSRCRSTATGMQVRDWIHVLDHCRGIEAAWRNGQARRGLQLRRPLREDEPRPDAHCCSSCSASRSR